MFDFNNFAFEKIAGSILIILFFWAIKQACVYFLNKRHLPPREQAQWRQAIKLLSLIGSAVMIAQIWIQQFQTIFTVLTLVAAALTIVHKEAILNLSGWMIIVWRGLFAIGDRIAIGGIAGDVIKTGAFYFTVTETGGEDRSPNFTGRLIRIPNSQVITQSVFNYSQAFRYVWHESTVTVTVECNWRRAEKIVAEAAGACSYKLSDAEAADINRSDVALSLGGLDPEVYLHIDGDKVNLKARYLCLPQQLCQTETRFWHTVLTRFEEAEGIKLTS